MPLPVLISLLDNPMTNKTNNKVEELTEEFLEKFTDKFDDRGSRVVSHYFNEGIFKDWIRQALTSSYEQGVRDEKENITKIVEQWMETSNPAHEQDLFDSLQSFLSTSLHQALSEALKEIGKRMKENWPKTAIISDHHIISITKSDTKEIEQIEIDVPGFDSELFHNSLSLINSYINEKWGLSKIQIISHLTHHAPKQHN